MNEVDNATRTKKLWSKEPSFLIGVGGVLATIIVGVVTYWLTAGSISREYKERINAGRNYALTAISKSIGEGVVPNKDKIQSVLNSVRRQYGIKEQDFETPETIINDLLARILSNEFLDAKRREELSNNLLTVKGEKPANLEQEKKNDINIKNIESEKFFIAILASIFSATITALSVRLISPRFQRLFKQIDQEPEKIEIVLYRLKLYNTFLIIAFLALAIIIAAIWFLSSKGLKFWPFLSDKIFS